MGSTKIIFIFLAFGAIALFCYVFVFRGKKEPLIFLMLGFPFSLFLPVFTDIMPDSFSV